MNCYADHGAVGLGFSEGQLTWEFWEELRQGVNRCVMRVLLWIKWLLSKGLSRFFYVFLPIVSRSDMTTGSFTFFYHELPKACCYYIFWKKEPIEVVFRSMSSSFGSLWSDSNRKRWGCASFHLERQDCGELQSRAAGIWKGVSKAGRRSGKFSKKGSHFFWPPHLFFWPTHFFVFVGNL